MLWLLKYISCYLLLPPTKLKGKVGKSCLRKKKGNRSSLLRLGLETTKAKPKSESQTLIGKDLKNTASTNSRVPPPWCIVSFKVEQWTNNWKFIGDPVVAQ